MWRFRKIFNFGAFRTSVSKGGVGYSYGLLGLRFGVTPYGKKYVSFGIPGTGLYFIKYLELGNQNAPKTVIKTPPPKAINIPTSIKKVTPKFEWWNQKGLDKF